MKGNLNISAWIASVVGLCAQLDRQKLDGLSGLEEVIRARKPPECVRKTSSMEIKCSLISVLKPSSCHCRRLLYLYKQFRLGGELSLITDPCPSVFCLKLWHGSSVHYLNCTHLSSSGKTSELTCQKFYWCFLLI